MKLIIGLGNPEEKYSNTRHNVGFRMLNDYAAQKTASFKSAAKFKADIAELQTGSDKVILAKPTTYYNLSGEAARAITDFYKIDPADVLVIHDELALPFGTIRTRIGGSDAGNNGVKSINQHLGTETSRIRIGVYNELRDRIDDAEFVLGKFSQEEADTLAEKQQKIASLIDAFITGSFEATTHS
jgi:PTH1 family peptidyl-tRNA hydrolase